MAAEQTFTAIPGDATASIDRAACIKKIASINDLNGTGIPRTSVK
jgi:hypothetical protein